MIRIEPQAWRVMIEHASAAYPREACGLLLGREAPAGRQMLLAVPTRNAFDGDQRDRFSIDPADLARVQREARASGLDLLGVFHSHPDDEAYFSRTDLENACPWYANVVLSIREGKYAGAACFNVDPDQTAATPEPFEIAD
jgi:proteasome lid subunit RPN8/RPN11